MARRRTSYSKRVPRSSGLTYLQIGMMGFVLVLVIVSRGPVADILGGGFDQLTTEEEEENETAEVPSDQVSDEHHVGIEMIDLPPQLQRAPVVVAPTVVTPPETPQVEEMP